MDVDARTQVAVRHRGAFDVPTGPTLAPGAVPGGLIGLGSLPEMEVERVLLVRVVRVFAGIPIGGEHLVPREAAHRPEIWKAGRPEIHRAALRVCHVLVD